MLSPEYVYIFWLLGFAIFIGLEIMTGNLLFLSLSFANMLLAGIAYFIPSISLLWQLFLYAVLIVLSTVVWVYFLRCNKKESKVNNIMNDHIGKVYAVTSAINHPSEVGKVQVNDSLWSIMSDDVVAVEDRVQVLSYKGMVLLVKKV